MISSKRGKLHFRFVIAAALLFSLVYALMVVASAPLSVLRMASAANASTANVTFTLVTEQPFEVGV